MQIKYNIIIKILSINSIQHLMNANVFDFLMIWVIWIIFIFSVSVGLYRMIKIIIWSYLLMATSLAIFSLIDFTISTMYGLNLNIPRLPEILSKVYEYREYINMLFYFILFFFIFKKFNIIRFKIAQKPIEIILMIFFTPFTVMSIIASLEVAVFGYKIIDYTQLNEFIKQFQENPWIYNFFRLTPIWIVLPWVITLIFSLFVWWSDE